MRPDPSWASQSALVAGFAQFASPDLIAREDGLEEALAGLLAPLGVTAPPLAPMQPEPALEAIYDAEVEKAARAAWPRDYLVFGFGPWKGQAA